MKKFLSAFAAALWVGTSLPAQDFGLRPAPVTVMAFNANQLEELLAPVALYPDALIALILPASTSISDVVLAARFLRDGYDPNQAENQPWEDSVRALARYPDVLKWMDQNLAWTRQLGEAFATQPAEVMNAVQRLRARARAAGNLVDTPQQQIVVETSSISIVPSQPDVIYVPYYDPEIVYVTPAVRYTSYSRSSFTFSRPYSTGFWLSYNMDWGRRTVWCVNRDDRQRHWTENRNYWHRPTPWGQHAYTSNPHYYRQWAPRSGHHHSAHRSTVHPGNHRVQTVVARPPAGGSYGRNDSDRRYNDHRDSDRREIDRRDVDRRDGVDRRNHAGPRSNPNPPIAYDQNRSRGNGPATTHVPGTPRHDTLSTGPSAGASTIPQRIRTAPPAQPHVAAPVNPRANPTYNRGDRAANHTIAQPSQRPHTRAPDTNFGNSHRTYRNTASVPSPATMPAAPQSWPSQRARMETGPRYVPVPAQPPAAPAAAPAPAPRSGYTPPPAQVENQRASDNRRDDARGNDRPDASRGRHGGRNHER